MVETGDHLQSDAVGCRAEDAAEIQIAAGKVAGHASAALRRPSRRWQFENSGRAVEVPVEV